MDQPIEILTNKSSNFFFHIQIVLNMQYCKFSDNRFWLSREKKTFEVKRIKQKTKHLYFLRV